ncbi:HAMP domain-containing sensor histidine kinase [Wukongibacter baidiensis]|uniref:sensor histidine kinase n=1 Tax=Wukongibacter baidiensis TaxID=1723361 RepID=UPI003D7F8CF0
MAIKSATKRGKIGKKLVISYLLILTVAFLVVGVSFKGLLTNYLQNEARKELTVEAKRISEILSETSLEKERVEKRLASSDPLNILGHTIDAKMIILDSNRSLIFSNLNVTDKKLSETLRKPRELKERGYVIARESIIKDDSILGYVVLLTKVKELKALNRIRLKMLLTSFLIAAAVAIVVSLFLERSLVKPIMKLRNEMNKFSIKKFNEIDIKTNDEIEELANSFNGMANKLKSYDEQQRRFLQNASHELKTPLMSIQGYAEGIKDGVIEGDEVGESLDIIIDESQRLKKLVDQIIYLTKLENIEEVFEFEQVNINEIAENAIRSINSLAIDKDIEIQLEADTKKLGNYDVEKMKRVFINLIGNAIRYAKKKILVTIEEKDDHQIIEVIDDGQGFMNDEDKKIFERFYKGDDGGTGIGLAITKAIVKGHGGNISAYNHESLGAVFRIDL